jgi:uncharacterized protein YbaR (Trm112 family)
MTQYIDKSALVAEIKRHISIAESQLALFGNEDERNRIIWAQQKKVCEIILSFIDTLEVREVDLEHEVESYWKQCNMTWCRDAYSMTHIRSMLSDIAKHFFELGLHSTITEEDCKLIWNIGDEIPCMTEEEFFKELLRRYKAQKGE